MEASIPSRARRPGRSGDAIADHDPLHHEEGIEMSLSDQLSKLASRTKEVENRAAAAREKAHDDLQKDVAAARKASKANAEALRESVDTSAAEVSAWWTDVGRTWDDHLAKMRKDLDKKKAAHDVKTAKRDADDANAYASYLIDYCYAAVEEAEYAVLDATLAQMEYDDLAAKQPS
jgi:hypothetical protein